MFGWFNKKEKAPEKVQEKLFKILYFPESKLYMIKYKDQWLQKADYWTGLIKPYHNYIYGATFASEEDAMKHIDKFKEQSGITTCIVKEVE